MRRGGPDMFWERWGEIAFTVALGVRHVSTWHTLPFGTWAHILPAFCAVAAKGNDHDITYVAYAWHVVCCLVIVSTSDVLRYAGR